MTIKIYTDQQFAIIENTHYKLTIKVNDNRSLLIAYASDASAWQRTYCSLEEFLLDNELPDDKKELWRWLARGMLGIPLEIIKNGI